MPEALQTILAAYAALVSTGALIVAYRAFKAGGHKVHVSSSLLARTSDKPAELVVAVANRGRGAASIARIDLNAPGFFNVAASRTDHLIGPALPYVIDGGSSQAWSVDAQWLLDQMRAQGAGNKLRAVGHPLHRREHLGVHSPAHEPPVRVTPLPPSRDHPVGTDGIKAAYASLRDRATPEP